jgi:hypothetical protein
MSRRGLAVILSFFGKRGECRRWPRKKQIGRRARKIGFGGFGDTGRGGSESGTQRRAGRDMVRRKERGRGVTLERLHGQARPCSPGRFLRTNQSRMGKHKLTDLWSQLWQGSKRRTGACGEGTRGLSRLAAVEPLSHAPSSLAPDVEPLHLDMRSSKAVDRNQECLHGGGALYASARNRVSGGIHTRRKMGASYSQASCLLRFSLNCSSQYAARTRTSDPRATSNHVDVLVRMSSHSGTGGCRTTPFKTLPR